MAIYRQIYPTFWTDVKVVNDFTPEDKYFYLYLMTNPHNTLCGCYEVSIKQMAWETGYNGDTVSHLLERLSNTHNVIRYSKDTGEVLILNWHKYNWTKSPKLLKSVEVGCKEIKDKSFRDYIINLIKDEIKKYPIDTLSKTDTYPMDTSVSVSVTDSVSNTVKRSKNRKVSPYLEREIKPNPRFGMEYLIK